MQGAQYTEYTEQNNGQIQNVLIVQYSIKVHSSSNCLGSEKNKQKTIGMQFEKMSMGGQ